MKHSTIYAAILGTLLLGTATLPCSAATIQVPLHKPTIQSAIDSAAWGDTVLVAPGTYFENIDFHGKAITVTAVPGARPAIIDGRSRGPVVMFHSGEGSGSVLSGFTIQHGFPNLVDPCYFNGGGVCIMNASPTILDDTIVDNVASEGAGIYVSSGSPLIQGNRIANNSPADNGGDGGGIALANASTTRIVDNVIENNSMGPGYGGGISLFNAGTPTITGNIIRGNLAQEGGGVWIRNVADAYIGQNLITGNTGSEGAGIDYLVVSGHRGPFVVNNTIADNVGDAVFADGFDPNTRLINNLIVAGPGHFALVCGTYDHNDPILHDNDIYAAGGSAYSGVCTDMTHQQGNISADPLFVSAATGDYHLQIGSPAIDRGANAAPRLPNTDFDGAARIQDGNLDSSATVDMGVVEFTPGKTTGPFALTVPRTQRMAASAPSRKPVADGFRLTGPDGRRTVRIYDRAGRLVTEVDANGERHRAR